MKNMLELLFVDDVAYADSRNIAEYFGKNHKEVLRDIRKMFEALGIERNFALSEYKDSTGRKLPCYHLDFDLTITLITGYDVKLRNQIVKQWHQLIKKRAEARTYARGIRHNFTDTLKTHGYSKQYEYINTTKSMKKPFAITAKKSDMTELEIKRITAAEYLAEAMIDEEFGYKQVNPICVQASEIVCNAIQNKTRRLIQ